MPIYRPPSDVLRVAVARNPPDAFSTCKKFPQYEQTIDCLFPGWCLEVLKMIADSLNVTIREVITPYPNGAVEWGALMANGSWSGTLGYLQRGEVDTICLMFQKTEARANSFSFADTVLSVRPIYVTKQNPQSVATLAASVYRSFNIELWMFMISMTLVQVAIFLFISRVQSKLFDPDYWSPGNIVWMLYEFFVDQKNDNDYPDPPSLSGKITLTVWALCQCVIMSSLYKGVLLSQLLNPPVTRPFSSTDEMISLIAKGNYKLTTNNPGNWYFDELIRSNASHYVKLRAAAGTPLFTQAATASAALDLVDQGGYIFPVQEDSIPMQIARSQRCNYVYISEGLPERTTHFIFAKNSPWLPAWNEQIVLTQQFQQRTFRKYFDSGFYPSGTPPKCKDIIMDRQAGDALDIFSILGVIIMWLGGLIIALFFLAGEKIVRYRHKLFRWRLNESSPIFKLSVKPSSASSHASSQQMLVTSL